MVRWALVALICSFYPREMGIPPPPASFEERGRIGYLSVQIVAQLLSVFLLDT